MGNEKHLRHAMSRYLIFRITLETNEKVEGKKEFFCVIVLGLIKRLEYQVLLLQEWNIDEKKNILQNFFVR